MHSRTRIFKQLLETMSCTSSKPSCLSFLALPREIRDEIYINLFLQSKNVRPADAWEFQYHFADPRKRPDRQVAYPGTLPHIASLPLLACCRQIRQETQAILARKDVAERRGATVYELDCIVESSTLLPTWIRLPASLASTHILEIDFRFTPRPDGIAGPFRFLPVFHLLQRLLLHGPYFHEREGQRAEVYIDSLILHISTESLAWRGTDEGDQAVHSRLERIWEAFLALESYGLLSGQIGRMQLHYGEEWAREVQVRRDKARVTGPSAWTAWRLRHPNYY